MNIYAVSIKINLLAEDAYQASFLARRTLKYVIQDSDFNDQMVSWNVGEAVLLEEDVPTCEGDDL
jgi:hypothetical protein